MANDIIFKNKDVKNRHIDLNSETPWYESLGATIAAGSSDTATIGKANIYIYNKELQSDQLQDFRCLELANNVILQFPITFNTTTYNYYIKSYKIDNTSKRLKYTSIGTSYNLVQLNENRTAIIEKGKYGLNGWEILSISKDDMPFYRYKDGTSEQEYLYTRATTRLVEDVIKDKTIDKNKVIINKISNLGNLAEYEIPGYYGIGNSGKAKTITLFGNINNVPEERQDFSFNQSITYDNKNSTSARMINQVPMEMRPYLLFEDFGEYPDSKNIPSNLWNLTYHYDNTNHACSLSFRGQTIKIKLYDDDRVILYIRDPIDADKIISAGCRLVYRRSFVKPFSNDNNVTIVWNYAKLTISSILDDSSLIETTDPSNFTMLVQGQQIKTYDITNSDWSANNIVQCSDEKLTNDFQDIIEKHSEVISFNENLQSDLTVFNQYFGLADDFSTYNGPKNECYICSCGKISLDDYGRFIDSANYELPKYESNDINTKKTVIFNDIPYIAHKPQFTKLVSENKILSKKNNDQEMNIERIFNTNIETTLGVIKNGNLSAKYYQDVKSRIDINSIPDIPLTAHYDSTYTSFNTAAEYDINLPGYKEMNRQGFNQIITTEGLRNPFKTDERINQAACAIVLWRKYTKEPITKKIEKLS